MNKRHQNNVSLFCTENTKGNMIILFIILFQLFRVDEKKVGKLKI